MTTALSRSPVRPAPAHPASRVLIVDDSAVARAVLARLVTGGRYDVAGVATSARAALDFLATETVDFILLDLAMPGMDGLAALPDILTAGQGARVIVVSSSVSEGAAATVRALALGAADVVEKPAASDMSGQFGRLLLDRLDRLNGSPRASKAEPLPPAGRGVVTQPSFDAVLIGASTGGIYALGTVLKALPASLRAPILVTQHLPAAFIPYFAAQIAATAQRPCVIAEDRMRLRPGEIVVAPGNAHLRCVSLGDGRAAVRLTHDRVSSGCMPSVDPMFASAAETFGARALAVVLSGMGRDGAEGARQVHEAGGYVAVQDEASSVVWGMPGAVAALGLAHAVLPLDAIARLIATGRRA